MQRAGEQGRWSYDRPRFASRERILPNRIRAQKAQQVRFSLRSSQEFRANQGAIWDEISEKAGRMEARSPSMAMSAIYERQSGNVEDYARHFRPVKSQVGAVFLINGRMAGLDSFGKPDTLARVFKKLVQSYALDAIDFLEPGKEIKVSRTGVSELIQSARSAGLETRPSVGLGTDLRLDSRKITGFALALDGQVVGWSRVLLQRRKGLRMAADDRVLGDGDFVEQIWSESTEQEKETLRRRGPSLDLATLAREIAAEQGITETELRSGSRMRKVAEARRVFCKSSVGKLGYPAAAVARFLGVTTSAVVRAARAE